MERWCLFTLCLCAFIPGFSQDTIGVEDLSPYTYYFKLDNKGLSGEGVSFLETAAQENHIIILGEYHGSKRISEFTSAFIPVLDQHGFDYFGLEVGPGASEILAEITTKPEAVVEALKAFNAQYEYHSDNRAYTPIPFFSHIVDAAFLVPAAERDWKLIGLDQEFKFGYIPLLDRAFNKLSEPQKSALKQKFKTGIDTLDYFYQQELTYYLTKDKSIKRFAFNAKESASFNTFLDELAATNPQNKKTVEDIRTSIDIYWYNSLRKYWLSNALRTNNFVANLRKGLQAHQFDFGKDKLLVKIGGLHAARGKNNYSMYDVGNTLGELARFYGNRSLHIEVMSRFYQEKDGTVIDELEQQDTWYTKNFSDLFQMGKKDQWTIIDLRPLKDSLYYQRDFIVNDRIKEYFDRYDVIMITPMDEEPTVNK